VGAHRAHQVRAMLERKEEKIARLRDEVKATGLVCAGAGAGAGVVLVLVLVPTHMQVNMQLRERLEGSGTGAASDNALNQRCAAQSCCGVLPCGGSVVHGMCRCGGEGCVSASVQDG